jgi:hypothetical protein
LQSSSLAMQSLSQLLCGFCYTSLNKYNRNNISL